MKNKKCSAYHLFFQNLANPVKTQIVETLLEGPLSVSELVKITKIEQSKISHALMNLRSCNIVLFKQVGKQRIYSLNKKTIVPILKIIDKHKSDFCSRCKIE